MEKSLKRRQQFRAVWGVSPRSINQKRDLKTVINVQNVSFSGPEVEPEVESEVEPNRIKDTGPETNEDENDEAPMNTEMFQQFIDANFPEQARWAQTTKKIPL